MTTKPQSTTEPMDRLRAALENIASQRLRSEIEPIDGEISGDFEGAYDIMINVARDALAAAPVVDSSEAVQLNVLTPEQKSANSVEQLAYWTWRKLSALNFADISGEIEAAINHALTAFGKDVFTAYNQAVEDAKAAIREAPSYHDEDDYCAASFINAIARKCSPHVYVNRLAAATAAPVKQSDAELERQTIIDYLKQFEGPSLLPMLIADIEAGCHRKEQK